MPTNRNVSVQIMVLRIITVLVFVNYASAFPAISDSCYLPLDAGRCSSQSSRYHFDPVQRICREFIYNGCYGNANNFASGGLCSTTCGATKVVKLDKTEIDIRPIDDCLAPKPSGSCGDAVFRFYFNKRTGKCQEFLYTNCKKSSNVFKNVETCLASCPTAEAKFLTTDVHKHDKYYN